MGVVTGAATALRQGVGLTEIIILLMIVALLLLFGPSKLPEFARAMGRAWGEFRRGKAEVERELRSEMAREESGEPVATRDEVLRAARELGVTTEARDLKDVKLDIAKAIEKLEGARLVAVAKSFGLAVEGVGPTTLREQIVRRMHI